MHLMNGIAAEGGFFPGDLSNALGPATRGAPTFHETQGLSWAMRGPAVGYLVQDKGRKVDSLVAIPAEPLYQLGSCRSCNAIVGRLFGVLTW